MRTVAKISSEYPRSTPSTHRTISTPKLCRRVGRTHGGTRLQPSAASVREKIAGFASEGGEGKRKMAHRPPPRGIAVGHASIASPRPCPSTSIRCPVARCQESAPPSPAPLPMDDGTTLSAHNNLPWPWHSSSGLTTCNENI